MCNTYEKYICHLSIGAWLEPKALNTFEAKLCSYELGEDNSKLAYRCIYLFSLLGDLVGLYILSSKHIYINQCF